MRERVNVIRIQTPEGVTFSLLLAGPVSRFLAWAVDAGCVYVAVTVVATFTQLFTIISVDMGSALTILGGFAVPIAYGIVMEWLWRGQTIGKRLLRLRVMDISGLRLQFSQVAIRNLLRAVDAMPLLNMVGGISCLASRRSQRLGDIAANTIVIRVPVSSRPDIDKLLPDKYNSLLEHPHLAARLRKKATLQEASIALRAVMRRDEFDDGARLQLFRRLAGYYRTLVTFPPQALAGLTDERYVTNVVEVLFSTKGEKQLVPAERKGERLS